MCECEDDSEAAAPPPWTRPWEQQCAKCRSLRLRRQGARTGNAPVLNPRRRQCPMTATLGLALLLACSLACRPAHALAHAHARSAALGPGRHARHAAARPFVPRLGSPRRQPWQNPCGSAVAVTPNTAAFLNRPTRPNKQQHRAGSQDFEWASPISLDGVAMERKSWSLRNVRGKIRIARAHLRHRRKHIHQVYGQVKVIGNKYSFDWLPQQQVQWYRSEIKCLDRDSQAVHVLPALRSALQNFSATFVELQKTWRWTTDRPGMKNRSLIINELAGHVKGMLCEVETAMQERSMPLPPDSLPSEGLVADPSRWIPDPDLTRGLIQDWGVVSAYTNALYGWALILRELGHAHKLRRAEQTPQTPQEQAAVATPPVGGCPAETQQSQHALRLHGRHSQRQQQQHPQVRRHQQHLRQQQRQQQHQQQRQLQRSRKQRRHRQPPEDEESRRRRRRRRRRRQRRRRQRQRQRWLQSLRHATPTPPQ